MTETREAEDAKKALIDRHTRLRCFDVKTNDKGEIITLSWNVKKTATTLREVVAEDAGITHPTSKPLVVGRGADDRLWVYDHGVWIPGKRKVHETIVWLLDEHYTPARQTATEKFLAGSADLPIIESAPVPAWINFRNGLMHWETNTFKAHDPAVLTTVQLNCDWNPEATCEPWLEFLSQVLPADAIGFMQELFGYAMLSGNPFEKVFLFFGHGRNGKGTVLDVLHALLGGPNTTGVKLQDLGTNRFATANLFGKLANISGDLDSTTLEETGTFKDITGNGVINAEHKGRDAFSFRPFAKHFFAANVIPGTSDTSPGFMDRWVVVPFPNSFSESARTSSLKANLTEPDIIEGVAAWAYVGLRRLMARGYFSYPDSVQEAKREFEVSADVVRGFLRECAVRAEETVIAKSSVYPVYQAWCHDSGRKPMGKQTFNKRILVVPGVSETKPAGGSESFKGLLMTKSVADFVTTASYGF